MDDDIRKKVKILRKSSLFTYNTDLGHIMEQQSILLTLAGKKPVSRITGGKWVNTATGRKSIPLNHDQVRDFFSKLGLQYSIKDFEYGTMAFISHDKNLIIKSDNNTSDKIEGELFGYPKTAFEAFGDDDLMMSLKEQDVIINSEGLPEFMPNFRFSKLHFKEELEVLKDWYDILKKYDFVE